MTTSVAPAPVGPTPAALAASLAPAGRVRSDWLLGRENDLRWLVAGVLPSFLLLALHLYAGVSAVVLWWAWIITLDGPHVFATLSRTYLDAEARVARRSLLLGSLAFFALGPACVGLGYVLGTRLPVGLYFAFAAIWAYWHVVRQHYGVMMLYKRKNADLAPADNRVDAFALYAGQLAPFVAFALTHPDALRSLGFAAAPPWAPAAVAACWLAFGASVLALAGRQLARLRAGLGVNGPKLLSLAATLSLAACVFSPYVTARADFLTFFAVVTAFHNVQYHAIVWFYHQNRYHRDPAGPARFGLAARVSARFAVYAACGVAFTLIYRAFGCGIGAHPGCAAFAPEHGPGGLRPTDLPQALLWGFSLHHYYLDQKIWRPGRDGALRRDLRLGAEGAQASSR